MALSPLQQATALLKESRTPLIIIPAHPTTDLFAAGVALLLIMERTGRSAHIACPDFSLPPGQGLIPKSDAVRQTLTSLRNFIISVDVSKTKLDELSYDIVGDKLHIYLAPKNGFYEGKDVTTSAGAFAYDVIVNIGVSSLEQLGAMYTDNAEFFYQTPIINIDHRTDNSRYGHANVVDVVASSISEIIFEMIQAIAPEHLDEQVATSLLAGIISQTKAFQSHTVTPRSLATASLLMTAGARRDEIIRHLYQTKTLAVLKLWGQSLAKLQANADESIVWSEITQADLQRTNSDAKEAVGVLDELMVNTPAAKIIVLFVEQATETIVHIMHQANDNVAQQLPQLTAHTPLYLSGRIAGSLGAVKELVLRTIGAKTVSKDGQ